MLPPDWNKELFVVFRNVICPVSQYLISWHLLLGFAVHSVDNVVSQRPHHIVVWHWNSFRYAWGGELLKEFDVAFSHKEHSVFQLIIYLTFDSLRKEGRVVHTHKCILEGRDSACVTVRQSTSFGWFLLIFKQFQKQPLQKSYFRSAVPLNVAFRLQHSARNQLFTVFREGIPHALLLWTRDRVDATLWTTVGCGVGWDLGLKAGGLVSRELQPHEGGAQWVFGCSGVRQCWCTHFRGYPKACVHPSPWATWILSLEITFLLVLLAELEYPISVTHTKIT